MKLQSKTPSSHLSATRTLAKTLGGILDVILGVDPVAYVRVVINVGVILNENVDCGLFYSTTSKKAILNFLVLCWWIRSFDKVCSRSRFRLCKFVVIKRMEFCRDLISNTFNAYIFEFKKTRMCKNRCAFFLFPHKPRNPIELKGIFYRHLGFRIYFPFTIWSISYQFVLK